MGPKGAEESCIQTQEMRTKILAELHLPIF